jgi:RsiW-degrading membrane proteinase PrsW (M82 family)
VPELRITQAGRTAVAKPGQAMRIGRSPDNDVVVPDPSVSRQHARLTWDGSGWLFESVGRSGTFLDGQPVTRLLVSEPVALALASPGGPVIRLEPVRDDLATALQILVPVRSWLKDPGWRRGLPLLVIVYGLLPLVFIAVFSSSADLTTPGWAYSLYIAPLWAIAFWLLIRPGQVTRQVIAIAVAAIIWLQLWIQVVTISINGQLAVPGKPIPFPAAIGVGINEETAKALPVLLAALVLLRWRGTKLDVRMWMFLGAIVGLAFGVREQAFYAPQALKLITSLGAFHDLGLIKTTAQEQTLAVGAELEFALRVFVDGFQHAIWAGVSGFFIGVAVNYRRRRVQLVLLAIAIPAVLHGMNDWVASNYPSDYWPWLAVQAVSLLLFISYALSAAAIEREVRKAPLFRGDSLLMDRFSEPGQPGP